MRKIALALCLACGAAQSADPRAAIQGGSALTSSGALVARRTLDKGLLEFATIRRPPNAGDTPLSLAIASAAKKDFIEAGIEESRRALLECQKETSAVLVMPSLRSDSQQAHCFRF